MSTTNKPGRFCLHSYKLQHQNFRAHPMRTYLTIPQIPLVSPPSFYQRSFSLGTKIVLAPYSLSGERLRCLFRRRSRVIRYNII